MLCSTSRRLTPFYKAKQTKQLQNILPTDCLPESYGGTVSEENQIHWQRDLDRKTEKVRLESEIVDSTAVIFCLVTSTILISVFIPFIRWGRNGRRSILKTNHLWKQRSRCNHSYWHHKRPIRWAWVFSGGRKINWETNHGEYLDRFIEIIYVLYDNEFNYVYIIVY